MADYIKQAYINMINALKKFKEETVGVVECLAEAADACTTATGNDDPSKKKSLEIYEQLKDFVKICKNIDALIEELQKVLGHFDVI